MPFLLLTAAWADCGDLVLDEGEACDDGNLRDEDGCDLDCQLEPGWVCEDLSIRLDDDITFADDLGLAESSWFFSSDKTEATQLLNAGPGVFLSEAQLGDADIVFDVRVSDPRGDGFIGWTLGELDRPFLLFDWKGRDGSETCGLAPEGLALSLVQPDATASELWCHTGAVAELGGLGDLSDVGWVPDELYTVRISGDVGRLRVFVDEVEQLAMDGPHPPGPLGFYTLDQQDASFRLLAPSSRTVCERLDGSTSGYSGGVCTGCSSTTAATPIWALFALVLLRRRR
ncbi:MAG: hypothetical protein GY913_13485 [Proteobacteria bacterium]|nr:hypothetical protein [Pseudomonadota bacterium]MCP4917920.1 hypothetical protein [Pseudomonadota bacterium]